MMKGNKINGNLLFFVRTNVRLRIGNIPFGMTSLFQTKKIVCFGLIVITEVTFKYTTIIKTYGTDPTDT